MKTSNIAVLAALCFAASAVAGPVDDMVGTWECRQPGVNYGNKPPILYVEAAASKAPDKAAFVLDVDGFTREVYGNSDVTSDADGWWKVAPAQGEPFMVRPDTAVKSRTPSMELKRTGASYRCLRLPPTGAQNPPAAQSAPPVEPQGAPSAEPQAVPSAEPQASPPPGAPSEEPAKKE